MATVADILRHKGRDVFKVDPDDSVYEAIAVMANQGVGSLLVTREDDIRGIVTERDYLGKIALKGRSSRDTKVHEIMSEHLLFVETDHDVSEALAIMTEARIRHLPVMEEGRLAGLVSIGDCVKQVSHEQKVQLRYLRDYIEDKYPG
ncbi:CBS domain-containing protein [bacterium]|nr:CBS domain-containing protein [bacterium]MBU1071721.1 CBS domain-containing protein [bacterium]MBU1674844.1 CBS domain-containing protein [bacterium]